MSSENKINDPKIYLQNTFKNYEIEKFKSIISGLYATERSQAIIDALEEIAPKKGKEILPYMINHSKDINDFHKILSLIHNETSIEHKNEINLFGMAVVSGHTELVKELLEIDGIQYNIKDNRGGTPLRELIANRSHHTEIFNLLIENDKVEKRGSGLLKYLCMPTRPETKSSTIDSKNNPATSPNPDKVESELNPDNFKKLQKILKGYINNKKQYNFDDKDFAEFLEGMLMTIFYNADINNDKNALLEARKALKIACDKKIIDPVTLEEKMQKFQSFVSKTQKGTIPFKIKQDLESYIEKFIMRIAIPRIVFKSKNSLETKIISSTEILSLLSEVLKQFKDNPKELTKEKFREAISKEINNLEKQESKKLDRKRSNSLPHKFPDQIWTNDEKERMEEMIVAKCYDIIEKCNIPYHNREEKINLIERIIRVIEQAIKIFFQYIAGILQAAGLFKAEVPEKTIEITLNINTTEQKSLMHLIDAMKKEIENKKIEEKIENNIDTTEKKIENKETVGKFTDKVNNSQNKERACTI